MAFYGDKWAVRSRKRKNGRIQLTMKKIDGIWDGKRFSKNVTPAQEI